MRSKTGCSSPGELEITCRTCEVAVCCSNASARSSVRWRSSFNSRVFSIAMTACLAKLVRERPHFLAINTNRADQLSLLQHWHGDHGSSARKLRSRDAHRIPFGVGRLRRDVGNVDHLLSAAKAAKGVTWARTNWSTLLVLEVRGRCIVKRNSAKRVFAIEVQRAEFGLAEPRRIR